MNQYEYENIFYWLNMYENSSLSGWILVKIVYKLKKWI